MNPVFRRTFTAAAIAGVLGFTGSALAQGGTSQAGGDTGNTMAAPSTPSGSAGATTDTGTSKGTGSSMGAGTLGMGASTGTTSSTGTGSAGTSMGGSSTSTNPSGTPGSAMPPERPAAAAAQDTPARRVFDQLDTNHDGILTFEEFSRAQFQAPK